MSEANLDATFAALADPTRRAILARLALGETSVTSWPVVRDVDAGNFQAPQSAGEGRPDRTRPRGSTRPARLNPAALKTAADWIEEYRRFWEQSFDRLDAYLRRVQADNKTTKRKGREK